MKAIGAALVIGVAMWLAFLTLTGCAQTLTAGAECKGQPADCFKDGGTSLGCVGGKLVEYQCTGKLRCSETPDRTILCDQSSGALPGTPCVPTYDGTAQCATDGGYLVCSGGSWLQLACAQGQTCSTDGGVSCR